MVRELPPQMSRQQADARRKGAVRTALLVGGVALAIYLAFILSGVLGR